MQSDNQLDYLKTQSNTSPLSRRDFVRALSIASVAGPGIVTAGLAGMTLTSSQRAEAAELLIDGLGKLPKVKLGTRMGNMMVAPICMSQDWNGELFAPAIEMGVNFVHKAHQWNTVPDEIKKLPRESYYTDITVDNTPNDPDNYDKAYNQVVQTLDRNGLKYYDIFRAHYGWRSLAAFNKGDNASYKAFLKLKKEGKVKYFGVSQHASNRDSGYETYPEMIQAEIDCGLIDSMQVWFSYGYSKDIQDVFAKASKAGIGMTAMKVFSHGRDKMKGDVEKQKELKAEGMVGRALLRDVMTAKRADGKPIFQTCVSALGNMQTFEENIGGVSPKLAMRDGFEGFHGMYV